MEAGLLKVAAKRIRKPGPKAFADIIAEALNLKVVHRSTKAANTQHTHWLVGETPKGTLVRVDPERGLDLVRPTDLTWRKEKELLSIQEMRRAFGLPETSLTRAQRENRVGARARQQALREVKKYFERGPDRPFTREETKRAIEELSFTPKRRELFEQPEVQELLDRPGLEQVHVFGSTATSKPNPSDLDLLAGPGVSRLSTSTLDIMPFLPSSPLQVRHRFRGGGKTIVPRGLWQKGKERYGSDFRWKRILGLTGATAGAYELTESDEAEAMPELIKPAGRAIEGAISSATKRLKGSKLLGRVVKEVRKGNKGWRNVIFESGETRAFTKQEVHDLCRKVGTDQYLEKFKTLGRQAQQKQALRSLEYHYNRSPMKIGSAFTTDSIERMTKQHVRRLREISPELDRSNLTFVRTTSFGQQLLGGHAIFPMPQEYVEALEGMDLIKTIDYRTKRLRK